MLVAASFYFLLMLGCSKFSEFGGLILATTRKAGNAAQTAAFAVRSSAAVVEWYPISTCEEFIRMRIPSILS